MAKFFIKALDGTAYTNLEDSSGRALSIATNKFVGTPYRKMVFKGSRKVWEDMKALGFTIEERFASSKQFTGAAPSKRVARRSTASCGTAG